MLPVQDDLRNVLHWVQQVIVSPLVPVNCHRPIFIHAKKITISEYRLPLGDKFLLPFPLLIQTYTKKKKKSFAKQLLKDFQRDTRQSQEIFSTPNTAER